MAFSSLDRSIPTSHVVLNSNSNGIIGVFPYTNSYGENLVVFFQDVLYAHTTSSNLSDQSDFLSKTVFVIKFSNSRLVTSTLPFACGWYGEDFWCVIMYLCMEASITEDMNYGPWYDTISLGAPNLYRMCVYRNLATLSSLATGNAFTSVHFVT